MKRRAGVPPGTTATAGAARDRYRLVVEDLTEQVVRFLPDGTILLVNDAYCRFLGKPREALVGRPWQPIAYAADVQRIEAQLATLGPDNPVVMVENRVHAGDGSIRWFQFVNRGFFDDDGRLLEIQSVARDIDDRVRATEALRENELRYRSLVDASPDAILVVAGDRIELVNPACLRLFGAIGPEELIGRPVAELAPHPSIACGPRAADAPVGTAFEGRITRLDGRIVDVELAANAFDFHGTRAFHVVIRDISERLRRNAELERLNRTLRAVSHSSLALLLAEEETPYLQRICRIVSEDCGYALVWVGLAQHDPARIVLPVASAGASVDELRSLGITWADEPRGRSHTGTAIRTRAPSLHRNIAADPRLDPFREWVDRHGYTSAAAFPLMDESGEAFGALVIMSHQADPFSAEESELLSGLARDVAFGVRTLRTRQAHRAAQSALSERETLLRTVTEQSPDPIFMVDREGTLLYANSAFWNAVRLAGPRGGPGTRSGEGRKSGDVLLDRAMAAALGPDDRQVFESGRTHARETEVPGPDGPRVFESVRAPFRNAAGEIIGLVGTARDITRQKRDEAARLEQLQRQRDTLVREVHHRIKNHLQGVIGLLQARQQQQPDLAAGLQEAVDQIRVIADVFGLQSQQSLAPAPLEQIAATVAAGGALRAEFSADVAPGGLTLVNVEEIVPVALILNELVTNAAKHASVPATDRSVRIELSADPQAARLRVRGGPARLPEGFDFERSRGLGTGLELVRALLPAKGVRLGYRQEGGQVTAELVLSAPVITAPAGQA